MSQKKDKCMYADCGIQAGAVEWAQQIAARRQVADLLSEQNEQLKRQHAVIEKLSKQMNTLVAENKQLIAENKELKGGNRNTQQYGGGRRYRQTNKKR